MGTELFKVTCVTCKATLSVRNPALIDQIVACPKCGSMVHVAPLSAAAPVSVGTTVSAVPVVQSSAVEKPLEPLADSLEPVTQAAGVPAVTSVLEAANTSNAVFIMWAVGSFVIGVTLMGTVLMLRGSSEPTAAAPPSIGKATPSPTNTDSTATGTDELQVESPSPTPSLGDVADQTIDENPAVQPTSIAPPPAELTLLGSIEDPKKDDVPKPTSTADQRPITPPQEQPNEKLVISNAEEPRVASKFDPLAIDPEEFSLAEIIGSAAADDGNTAVDQPADEDRTAEERPTNASVPVRLDEQSGHGCSSRIASIQLKRQLPALTVKDMPLLHFLAFVSQLSGVPVSVGPEQLQMAGITPGRPVSVDMKGSTIAGVLESTLGPLKLEATTDGPQIVVLHQDGTKVRSVDYPVDELLGERVSAADIGKWIERLIAPESWQSAGGDGLVNVSGSSLEIEQTQAIQYQVLFFLERVRLAKGLALRSKYPAQLLSGKPYGAGIADRLDAPAMFTFSHNTPLAEVFRYWQGEAGLPIFVDWPAVASVGLWPDSRITCRSANEPWQAALDKILSPLDLAWRPAPGGAIQITSRARVKTEPVVDIYPTGTWHGDATDAVAIDDPVNGLTYVRAPAVAHRY